MYIHILYTHLNIYEQLLLETCGWRPGLVLISRFRVVDLRNRDGHSKIDIEQIKEPFALTVVGVWVLLLPVFSSLSLSFIVNLNSGLTGTDNTLHPQF